LLADFDRKIPMRRSFLVGLCALLSLSACNAVYYATMEKLGKEKRDILIGRVEDAREDQTEAKDQFRTTLDRFRALTGFDGGELESRYRDLADDYESCEDAATTVRDRIASIKDVGSDMFEEWEAEIEEIPQPELRSKSAQLRSDSLRKYEGMLRAMDQAASTMDPVLAAFKGHVLFLKHQLNAQMVASLQNEVVKLDDDVTRLVAQMEKSISEADSFLKTFPG
jgi:Protein of unknown function (DUF2959)